MSYSLSADPAIDLIVVTFHGDVPYDEERQVVAEIAAKGLLLGTSRVLLDRTSCRMQAQSDDADTQIEFLEKQRTRLGRPRIAQVAPGDLEYGMLRLFQQKSEAKDLHDMAVFRTWDEACTWLDVAPSVARALQEKSREAGGED